MQPQENQANITGLNNNRQLKKSEAWARFRAVQIDPETGEAATDENGNVISHYICRDVPFDGTTAATRGIIKLAKENPEKQFQVVMTVNVPDPNAQNQEPLLDF